MQKIIFHLGSIFKEKKMIKKSVFFVVYLACSIMASPNEILIEKKIAHKTQGNLQGYKTVQVDLYEEGNLEDSLWSETHNSVKFTNGNMQLSVGASNALNWTHFHSLKVPIIGLTIDGEKLYVKPSGEIFSHISSFAHQAGMIDYKNIQNVPLISTKMIEDGAVTFKKLKLTKQDILNLGISSHTQSDVLKIVQENPTHFIKNIDGALYEVIQNQSINNLTSAGYRVLAQNNAISGIFRAHKDINGTGRIQMGSTSNAIVDIIQNGDKAISINNQSLAFNKPFNLNFEGEYKQGDLLFYNGDQWIPLNKGATNQVLGVNNNGLGWIDQTASDYIQGTDKKQHMEVRTLNNASGSTAGFIAAGDSGNIKGVLQAHKKGDEGSTVEIGSQSNHDVIILRKGKHAVTITLNEKGQIVVKADQLDVKSIKAESIDAETLNSASMTTNDLVSESSSLGSATATNLESEKLIAKVEAKLGKTIATDFEIQEQENALSVPIGTILPFVGEIVPDGYLLCNGQNLDGVSDKRFYKLYDVIETKFGGTSRANYKVPNLKGYFLRGARSLTSVGEYQSDATAVNGLRASSSTNGSHSHKVPLDSYGSGNVSDAISDYKGNTRGYNEGYFNLESSGAHSHTIQLSGDSETRPMNMSVNYIIKY
jgi:microcystin-dependent protein